MSNNLGRITNYEPFMAKEAAEMFNAFNELWPGGFGGGVPYTEERVHDWLDKTSAIADLIAINDKDELCGYCGLYPHWRDKDAAYISILGVTPKAKGKKFGKRLLLKALEIAKENSINRVDLNTWSGNMEAVPLYKKVGLYWVPETSVYMQDFIPGILQEKIANEWFEKHPDWYGNFIRSLDQTPDKFVDDGMELYSYKFQVDDDILIVNVDRFGWGFTGFDRTLDGKRLSVNAKVKTHEIFTGIQNEYRIVIHNDLEDETVDIDIKEFSGLKWLEKPPKTIKVKKGETTEISLPFTINKDATLFRDNNRSNEKIKAKIKIAGYKFDLITSGKIQTPIKLRSTTENRFSSIPRGKEVSVPLDIINTTNRSIKGTIEITIDNLPKSKISVPFELKPEQISGIEIPVKLPDSDDINHYMIRATPKITIDNKKIETSTYDVPLFVKTSNMIELVELKDVDRLYLLTDKLAIRVFLEGGNTTIFRQENSGSTNLRHFSGPPFGLSLDRTLKYEYSFERVDGYHLLILTGYSLQVPGLKVEKNYKISPGINEVEYWVKYSNVDKDNSIHVSARTQVGSQGISINPAAATGCAYTPINNKIIESDSITNFLTYPVIPSDPKIWHETWSAVEGLLFSDLSAWIWKPDNTEKITLNQGSVSSFESETKELQPGEEYYPIKLWYSFGFNNLQEVRRRWSQLVGKKEFSKVEEYAGPEITKALTVELLGDHCLETGKTHELTLNIMFVSAYPLKGTLSLNLPNSWNGKFKTEKGLEDTIPIPELVPFQKTPVKIEVTIPDKITSQVENIQLHLSGEFEFDFNNYVILSRIGSVDIKPITIEDGKAIELSNGNITFAISSEIGGNLIHIKDKQNRTFLLNCFPNVQPKFFMGEYLGGLQPIVFQTIADDPFSRMEKTTSEEIVIDNWKGVKVSWIVEKEKQYLKGHQISISYLTIPYSDLVRIIITLDNPTPRVINWIGGILADVGIGGSTEGNIIEVEGAKDMWIRNSVKKQFISQGNFSKPFSRIIKGDQSISFILPKNTYGSSLVADFGMMLVNWQLANQYALPNSKSTMEFLVMVNQPREKMAYLREAMQ
ncbi:MAG: GNAT family N-acetyltransferase [Asgard group archaeon]|nr:GNAT family N-acetyltransferase [Asgard group archaeon]